MDSKELFKLIHLLSIELIFFAIFWNTPSGMAPNGACNGTVYSKEFRANPHGC
jgi:hypothetical protein